MTRGLRRRGAKPIPIAIIGAACRFPGAPDLDAYWRLLIEGRDAVTTVPADRFTQDAFLHPRRGEAGRTFGFPAGVVPDVAGFDAGAFGISPREAAEMDPQQRLLLEVTAEALDDAGLPHSRLAGTGTGVFVGASLTDYADLRQADPASGDRYFMTGGALSILANRIGNIFDLHGSAQVVDTACSSSLVALHWAAEALHAGRMPAAIVGGVNLLLSPYPFLGFSRAGMLSPTGRCRAFDAAADGYVRAEGAGVVLLKPLADALSDGDPVRAVLVATATNAAGRTLGLSLPNGEEQAALLRRAMAEAGVRPERIAYFEAHGTGTAVGDPIEATALGEAIGRHRGVPLAVGSAKTNIGHTEPASGMAGLLKALLVLEHGRIPPSLHFETPNPAIDFAALGLRVPTAAEPLSRRRGGARAVVGINSFGFGGTNATALLAAPPLQPATTDEEAARPATLPPLLLSAHSAPALDALAARWQAVLAATPAPALPALLRGAARHRDLLPHRLSVRGGAGSELIGALAAWRAGAENAAAASSEAAPPGGRRVAFVFSGNGAQWAGMGRDAFAANPAFRTGVHEADAALAPHLGWSVAEALAAGVPDAALAATDRAQPLLFAVQHGIVAALAAEGITPDLCLGHSVGEVAAAAASGLLAMSDAARLICVRSRHQHRTRGAGRMAAVGASAEAVSAVLAACGREAGRGLEIAAVNAPASVTVAGPAPLLRHLSKTAAARHWAFVELDLDYAFHSAAMDAVRDGLVAELEGLAAAPPRVPLVSTVTGEPAGAELVLDSRDPGFADALRAAWPEGVDVVLNSLAGDTMERSLDLLRPFGRFVELGKRDFAEARRVSLRPLRRNAAFFAVDVDELPRARPAVAARLLSTVAERLSAGTLRPLPATLHTSAEAESAFRTLQAGGHIGKLVLRPPAVAENAVCPKAPLALAREGTVVVVGGTSGFGLAAARALAEAGVRHVALLSRRGMATPGVEAAVRDLAGLGATVTVQSCDATDPAALAQTLDRLRASSPPIRGVVHAAAVLEDGAAASLDPRRAARVLAAKLTVAENLDRLTAADPLALFVLFSSATVPVGSPGQAAYVAANAALEALARRRRAAGRPALAVQWGPIANAGMLAGDAARTAGLQRRLGAAPMRAGEALAALPGLLESGLSCAGLARMTWREAGVAALPVLAEPAFEAVRGASATPGAEDLRARLRDAPAEEALDLLRATLAAELARILRLPAGAVPAEAPLAGLGLDSLGGMELRTALEARLGTAVPLAVVTETLTLDTLARRIADAVRAAPAEAEAAALIAAHEPTPSSPPGDNHGGADTMGAAA